MAEDAPYESAESGWMDGGVGDGAGAGAGAGAGVERGRKSPGRGACGDFCEGTGRVRNGCQRPDHPLVKTE